MTKTLSIIFIFIFICIVTPFPKWFKRKDELIRTTVYSGWVTKSEYDHLILGEIGNVKYKVYHTNNCFLNECAKEGANIAIRKNTIKSGKTVNIIEEYKIESYDNDDNYQSKDGFVYNMTKI